jgi:hypothetical protein
MNCHLLLVVLGVAGGRPSADVPLQPGTVVRFASVDEGKEVLTARDAYVAAQGPFDRAARMMTDRVVGEDEYLAFVGAQALPWQAEEREKIAAIVDSVRSKIDRFRLPLPEQVLLIKTTGKDEGNAAYCRAGAIVLPQRYVDRPADRLEGTLVHELFHILSRNNRELRDVLYAVVGFRPCGRIPLPDSLRSRRITNPDAVEIEYAIRVTHNGEPLDVTPVLYASVERYDAEQGGPFFRYLTFRLMAIEPDGERWVPKLADGQPQLLRETEVSGFYEQIGRNTEYIIHPEEILADNFVRLVNRDQAAPTPRILEEMERLLRK